MVNMEIDAHQKDPDQKLNNALQDYLQGNGS